MSQTRRDFLKTGALLAASVTMPEPLFGSRLVPSHAATWPIDGVEVKGLAFRAIDAARSAGASYADVRLTHIRRRRISAEGASESENLAIGARALVNGYWGFVSSPVWSADEAARLGGEAVAQAKTNALGKQRIVELGTIPVVRDGHWVNTADTDPFSIPLGEMYDFIAGTSLFWHDPSRFTHGAIGGSFECRENAFASIEGSYCTQVLFKTGANVAVNLNSTSDGLWLSSDILPRAARGWEYLTTAPFEEELARLLEEAERLAKLPRTPVEVGRYDAVFDARAAALLLDETLGAATELDRALGYEANASGTSYLNDPLGMLGSYEVGAPLLTVTANRSLPGGLATVRWDDEGVAPDDFTLVKDGVLTDFQTTRESAAWLEDYYVKSNEPVRSHGCAGTASALDAPLCMPPNLRLEPGAERTSFEDLVKDLKSGIIAQYIGVNIDFQHLNGLGRSADNPLSFFEVKNGKRVARIDGLGFLFRSPELWQNVTALGGPTSVRASAHGRSKGQPAQKCEFTVEAPPVQVKQLTVIDPTRKA